MRFNRALLVLPILAACASPEGEYPSLARRPAELGIVQAAPPPPAAPPSSAVMERIDQLAVEAARAHEAFVDAAPGARRMVEAARDQGTGSDSWARAQVALSELQARRAPTTIALADIDRIYADVATEGGDVTGIAETRERLAAQAAEQDRTIDSLAGALE